MSLMTLTNLLIVSMKIAVKEILLMILLKMVMKIIAIFKRDESKENIEI